MPSSRAVAQQQPIPLSGPGVAAPLPPPPPQHVDYGDGDDDKMDTEDNKIYCFCNRTSFGDMVACDNEDCEREWVR